MPSTSVRERRDVVEKFVTGLYEFENSRKGINPRDYWLVMELACENAAKTDHYENLSGHTDEETLVFEISVIVTLFFLLSEALKICL